MTRPPLTGAGRDDVSSVPDAVQDGGQGMRPHVRERLRGLAVHCVQSAEAGELAGAALLILCGLYDLGVKAGSGSA